jgi:CBS domain-containing protein
MTTRNNPFARELRSSERWGQHVPRTVLELVQRAPPLVSPETLATEARRVALHSGVHHLAVVSELGEPLGVVCKCALLAAPVGVTVSECMRGPAITVRSNSSLEEASALMIERGVGTLPVVYDFTVVGMITRADLVARGALSPAAAPRCSNCGSFDHVGPLPEAGAPVCRRCRSGAPALESAENENEELAFGD